jgi:hypothetical protein
MLERDLPVELGEIVARDGFVFADRECSRFLVTGTAQKY